MKFVSIQKAAGLSLSAGLVFAAATPVLAWTGPTAAPPNNNVSAPVNVSATAQTKTGPLGIGITPSQMLDVNGYVAVHSTNGEGGTIQLQGNNGVNTWIEDNNGTFRVINSPWNAEMFRVDQSGNFYVPGSIQSGSYVYGPNAFGGMWSQYTVGGCTGPNVYTGACSCPGFAPNAGFLSYTYYASNPVAQYYCY